MTRALRRALFLLGSLAALASPIDAQVCRGVASESPVWFAMQYGRAAKHASVHGADIAWQLDQGLLLFTDANVTMYPQPDPARGRVAVGMGIEVGEFRGVGVCTTFGFERERIGDLQVQRIPTGIALGWSRPLAGVARRIGFTVEPFYVHGHERIERFGHTSNFVSGRAGMIYLARGYLVGLKYEHAFDADARWHATARDGFTFN